MHVAEPGDAMLGARGSSYQFKSSSTWPWKGDVRCKMNPETTRRLCYIQKVAVLSWSWPPDDVVAWPQHWERRCKTVVANLKHKVCTQFIDKIRRRKNFSENWIVRAKSVSNVHNHTQNEQHFHAMLLLKKQHSGSTGLSPLSYTLLHYCNESLYYNSHGRVRAKFINDRAKSKVLGHSDQTAIKSYFDLWKSGWITEEAMAYWHLEGCGVILKTTSSISLC